MKSKFLLLSGMATIGFGANAQQLMADYIEWPSSTELATYVNKWEPGKQLFEDENFFISRVKLKNYIRNTATQVNVNLNEQNDKNLIFWVPCGEAMKKGVHTDALPNGLFDNEVFSMWPYVTHYGDWTSPHGWAPGGFADAAHKHGTLVSGVASIPYGSISQSWSTAMNSQAALNSEKLAHFLYYHGVNGLGYNSEFSGGSGFIKKIQQQHEDIVKYFKSKDTRIENPWYDGVTNSGTLAFTECLSIGTNDENFGSAGHERANLFVNYNWNTGARISNTQRACEQLGRNMLDLYAGHNMQSSPVSTNAEVLSTCNYSIGIWGAHQNNMLWQNRNSQGSSPKSLQATYQKNIEQFFSNGKRNPIANMPFNTNPWRAADDWFGMSRLMTAHSSLGWDLAEEPFITYFNLGNGVFFNWKGERQNDNEWYNIGIQDYMPTWRFWFANKFLGKEASNIAENGLDAKFIWDDAWMGGSCLSITGSSADEYLHLFKTRFELKRDDKITVRYKLLTGSADVNLALSVENAETTIIRESDFKVISTGDEADDVWVEKTFEIKGPRVSPFQGRNVAMIALHISNAENLQLYLGELSIKRGTTATPVAPSVTLTKVLANNYSGVDGKIIFNMPSNKDVNEPVYNLDVNTSMFRVYAQQEGCDPVNMGATTSWAAIVYSAPVDRQGSQKMRFGVSAVSADFNSESEISWSEYMPLGDYEINNEFAISKSIIKPNEPFSIYYLDELHAPADWKIYNSEGSVVAEKSASLRIDVEGLEKVGGYDLVINEGKDDAIRLNFYIQVSPESVGAIPEIKSLAMNGTEDASGITIEPAEKLELTYTGRNADGFGSRGLQLSEKLFGVNAGELGLQSNKSFSVATWIRLGELDKGIYSLMTIENRGGSWPLNNWGFFWNRIDQDGYIENSQIDGAFAGHLNNNSEGNRIYCDFSDSRITPNSWVHVAWVFEINESNQIRYIFYINGVRQASKTWMNIHKGTREGLVGGDWNDFSHTGSAAAFGHNETETGFCSTDYPLSTSDWISFGGSSQNIVSMKATLDDVQVWNKAMTDDDVKAAMNGFTEETCPEALIGWWDFNDDCSNEFAFASKGKNKGAKAYRYTHETLDGEGQSSHNPVEPEFTAGCPFLESDCYAVVTVPTWKVKRGVIESAEGKDTEGKAVVTFDRKGDYVATLTLENSHGVHSKDYPVITVGDKQDPGVGVEGIESDATVEVYAADGTLFVSFPEAGNYAVKVFNSNGQLVNGRAMQMEAGNVARLHIANAGVYVVNITRDGAEVRTVKVVVR